MNIHKIRRDLGPLARHTSASVPLTLVQILCHF